MSGEFAPYAAAQMMNSMGDMCRQMRDQIFSSEMRQGIVTKDLLDLLGRFKT